MSSHRAMQMMMYEYVTGTVTEDDRTTFEAHLAGCAACRADLAELREALTLMPVPSTTPDAERPEAFWDGFSSSVMDSIAREKAPRRHIQMPDWIETILLLRPRYVLATAGVFLVLVMITSLLINRSAQQRDVAEQRQIGADGSFRQRPDSLLAQAREFQGVPVQRVNQYFRKSKTLLVGFTNLRADAGEQVDFSTERRISGDLIREARYLREQPLDSRSRQLMKDLEVILIELKNIEMHNDLPNIEIISSGIRRENLLFKIRLAEAMYDSAQFVTAADHYSREDAP